MPRAHSMKYSIHTRARTQNKYGGGGVGAQRVKCSSELLSRRMGSRARSHLHFYPRARSHLHFYPRARFNGSIVSQHDDDDAAAAADGHTLGSWVACAREIRLLSCFSDSHVRPGTLANLLGIWAICMKTSVGGWSRARIRRNSVRKLGF
jgi:hypothetical protein